MKYLLYICLLLSVFSNLLSVAYAAPGADAINTAEMIEIDGVHLHCPGCVGSGTSAESGNCEITIKGEFTLLPCEQALDVRLRELAAAENYPAWLNERELLRLLFQPQRKPSTARAAYILLFKSPAAEKIFSVYAKALLLRHPRITASLISDGLGSAQVLKHFWKALPALPQTEAIMEIRAAIIARDAKFGLQEIVVVSELSERNIPVADKRAQQLREIAQPSKFYAIAIICGLLLFGCGLVFVWRKKAAHFRASREAEKMLAADYIERKEFAEQLGYFELCADASIDDLSVEYRRRAKILHPDTSTGSASAFAELNRRYEQARKFMREKRK